MIPSEIEISTTQALELAQKHYDLNGEIKKLPGEVDFNFYIKNEAGNEFTLKISRPGEERSSIAFQAAIMHHLAASNIPLEIPEVVLSNDGKEFIELENKRFLRLQKWVSGRMLGDVNPRTPEILENWGETVGLFSLHLANFDHSAAHRFYKWNPSESLFSIKKNRQYFKTKEERAIADYFKTLFEKTALPYLPQLRKSVNYNDAHEHNLLVNFDLKNPKITGAIDFGDALFTETINELAIACAYASMHCPDPLEAAKNVVSGYHKIFPLQEEELAVLFPLICARLMITVASAAENKHLEPDNEYLLISEKPAWDLLKKFKNVSPDFAHYSFRDACDLPAHPHVRRVHDWLSNSLNDFAPIVNFKDKKVTSFDLSVGSLDLGNNSNFETISAFEKTIARMFEEKNSDIGIGGYGEIRPIYTTDAYRVEGNSGPQWRTIHLGIDVWSSAGTAVFAPLDGIIHSFQNNVAERDYGPTIILEHRTNDDLIFHTLYGHLSAESLIGLEKGMSIKKGQKICEIGAPPINGNWPTHLHFQVILDMLGKEGDFPGVAFPAEAKIWKSICPDAKLFFSNYYKNSNKTLAQPTISKEKILKSRSKNLGRSLSISYEKPLHMVRGFKQYLYDSTGRRYLDTANNVPHVGHQHPRVVRAAQRQIELLNTNTRYLHENIVLFAEELLATLPPELSVVHFVNSGSEANELAMRMIEANTRQKDMIAVEVGYHGNTARCIDVSSYKFDGKGGNGAPDLTQIVPIPDRFRGIYRGGNTGEKYADHILKAIEKIQSNDRNVGGFICESILSCGGQIVLPEDYLKKAYAHIRAAGGLCIADEVQVGFGRVGDAFWGFEMQGVVPDIVTMGKPVGNGHPLAAVVTTAEVAEKFANGMEFFNTFGGNPVSCAIGREVLQIIKDENLQAHALDVGEYLKKELKNLQTQFPIIGDVRGHGLFLGFELIKDQKSLEPAAEQASYLANRMRERGILMSTDGPFHNVLKIKPPMCFDKSNADFLIENLELVLKEDFLKR